MTRSADYVRGYQAGYSAGRAGRTPKHYAPEPSPVDLTEGCRGCVHIDFSDGEPNAVCMHPESTAHQEPGWKVGLFLRGAVNLHCGPERRNKETRSGSWKGDSK